MSQKTFRYEGLMYVRPIGRGICLDGPRRELQDLEEAIGLEEGYYNVRLTLQYEPCGAPPEDPGKPEKGGKP
jgi:hypothetical protein